jgi:hypothetical protein
VPAVTGQLSRHDEPAQPYTCHQDGVKTDFTQGLDDALPRDMAGSVLMP